MTAWHGRRGHVRVPTVAKTVKLPEALNEQLRLFCFENRISQQNVLLAAIVEYLEKPHEDVRGFRRPVHALTTREKLLKLADGTRNADELARLCGVTRQHIYGLTANLKSKGVTILVRRRQRRTRSELLAKVIEASGGMRALAKALGVSKQAISLWKQVPTTRVPTVEDISGIHREILRPDLYDEQGKFRNQPETTKEKLSRLADGTRSASELAQLCGVSRPRVHQLLAKLRTDGAVANGASLLP
jgi:biotin operon repressor